MATQSGAVLDHTFKAAADLSAKQYFLVKYSAADTVALCGAAADRAFGVLMNKPAATGGKEKARIDREQLQYIRKWAHDHGLEFSDRGRIPNHVMAVYNAMSNRPNGIETPQFTG
jgi:hypothetical protein